MTRAEEEGAALERVPADCPWPIVLAFDPGTRAMGYGALVLVGGDARLLAAGTVRVSARLDVPRRLAAIRAEAEGLIERLRPAVVVVERAFAARNVQSALRIGEARGVLLACIAGAGIEVVQVAPAAAKKAVVGNGRADKAQVARMVEARLGWCAPAGSEDATDALALALAHVQRSRFADTLGAAAARAVGPTTRAPEPPPSRRR